MTPLAAPPALVVLTGAGISADSGLPTFRGAGGLWSGRRAEELATPEAWAADPALVWRFYQERRRAALAVEPNRAHAALAELEAALAAHGRPPLLVTQNVDDLHERAGSAPLHVHGELLRLRCERCGHARRDAESLDPERFVPCPACGFPRLRPDVVWYGEVPRGLRTIDAALARCTAFLAVGTSGVVYPAAGFLDSARRAGAATRVVGLDEPENLDPRDALLRGRAVDVVPELVARWLAEWGLAAPE